MPEGPDDANANASYDRAEPYKQFWGKVPPPPGFLIPSADERGGNKVQEIKMPGLIKGKARGSAEEQIQPMMLKRHCQWQKNGRKDIPE